MGREAGGRGRLPKRCLVAITACLFSSHRFSWSTCLIIAPATQAISRDMPNPRAAPGPSPLAAAAAEPTREMGCIVRRCGSLARAVAAMAARKAAARRS